MASRVEQRNKEFQSNLLVTEAAYGKVGHRFQGQAMEAVLVKGRAEPV
ncbi:MAG: hypothetical protein J0L75_13175 [Spirochaetes bacterium]|nr:hypothetical protein [Spirochaetota bacterium]